MIDLDSLTLAKGSHDSPDDGMCIMEAVAFVAGEPFSDHPACASEVAAAFLRTWNDSLPEVDRQELKRYVPLLVGSAGTPEVEAARSWMALDWLVRTFTPTWLRLAGLNGQAVASLPELTVGTDMSSIRPVVELVRRDASAARDAAWEAARAAARTAAWEAARAAAWEAAQAAARDAAWEAARAAAGATAQATARTAAEVAAWGALATTVSALQASAAGDAARDALAPTVTVLQASAHQLVEKMLQAPAAPR